MLLSVTVVVMLSFTFNLINTEKNENYTVQKNVFTMDFYWKIKEFKIPLKCHQPILLPYSGIFQYMEFEGI